jgi:hypothetical protein
MRNERMNRLFNPQNRELPSFFRWLHFFIFSNKRGSEASCSSNGNCVSEGHRIRSFESSRFIHNRIRNRFNNAYGLSKNGFNPDTRSIFPGNIKPIIVYLKQLDNTYVEANSTGSGLLNQVKNNICSILAVKNSKQCTGIRPSGPFADKKDLCAAIQRRGGIKKIKHFLLLPHPFKLSVFSFLIRPFPRKICVHCIQPFIYPGKRCQGSYGFILWHGFRSNGKFNFRFTGRQFTRNFNSNQVASRYFNRLFDGHEVNIA